jgi:hypothetical protein
MGTMKMGTHLGVVSRSEAAGAENVGLGAPGGLHGTQ